MHLCIATCMLSAGVIGTSQLTPSPTSALEWSTNPTPAPSPTSNVLNSISCSGTSLCVSVGYYATGSVDKTLTEFLSGKSWTVVTSPDQGSSDNTLKSVSCPTTTFCDAVGFEDIASGASETLVETFNGSVWSIVPSPDSGTLGNSLNSVWCGSSSSCVAVGSYTPSTGGEATLVETFNGSVWSIVSSPSPGAQGRRLTERCLVHEF